MSEGFGSLLNYEEYAIDNYEKSYKLVCEIADGFQKDELIDMLTNKLHKRLGRVLRLTVLRTPHRSREALSITTEFSNPQFKRAIKIEAKAIDNLQRVNAVVNKFTASEKKSEIKAMLIQRIRML